MTNTTPTIPGATYNKSSWSNILRALQAAAISANGKAVVKIVIMVDGSGDPIVHTRPTVQKVEPRGNDSALYVFAEVAGE